MTNQAPRRIAHASLLLALLSPAAPAADSLEAIAYVEYDAAAPLDPTKSYGCLADARLGAGSAATRQLTCTRRVPLAELCGTDSGGQLAAGCPFIPGSTGAGPQPTAAQVTGLADALLQHFQGHQPKLNFAAERLGRGGSAAYEMNLQPGPAGASPSIGAWNEASAAERSVKPTPLQVDDPNPADTRYGNTEWVNPAADPAEWNALFSTPTLDHVYQAAHNLLATSSVPDPPAAAVLARARAEVARCRSDSLALLRTDIEHHLATAAGGTAPRPTGSIDPNCLADPGPPRAAQPPTNPLLPPLQPPPTYTACDGSVHSSQAAASAVTCSPTTTRPPTTTTTPTTPTTPTRYTACDGSTHSSRAAAQAVDCSSGPDEEEEDDHTTTPTTTTPTVTTPTTTPTTTTPTVTTPTEPPTTTPTTPSKPSPPPSITCWDGSTVEDAGDCSTPDFGGSDDDDDTATGGDGGGGGGGSDDDDDTGDDKKGGTECIGVCIGDPGPDKTPPPSTTPQQEKQQEKKQQRADPDDLNDCQGGEECPYKDFDTGWLGWF